MSTRDENVSDEEYVSAEEYARVSQDYWRVVRESEGFDLEDVSIPSYMCGTPICVMRTFEGLGGRYPCRGLMKSYCMVGLHRYNMFEGTNYQLSSLIKFNKTMNCVSSYYLTLLAHDPDVSPSAKTFQVRIDEKSFGRLDFTCSVARIKEARGEGDSPREPFIPHYHGGPQASVPFVGELPRWPSAADLSDESRFYMLNRLEWEANDWILMYLGLVIYSHDKLIETRVRDYMNKLKIVNVVVETSGDSDLEQTEERLNAKSAHVYITFKGLAEAQAPRQCFEVGEHVERRAIVRRVICEKTGEMSLLGKLCGGKMERPPVRYHSGEEAAQSSKRSRTRRRS